MSTIQYDPYCNTFNLKKLIKPLKGKQVRGIGGCSIAIGEARVQIPFKDLGIIIDVKFLILKDKIPSLLSMKDMLDNGLDLSIQGRYITLGNRKQDLHFQNYFLIHRWMPHEQPYVFYTFPELQRIHATFGHPSIKATRNLLKRASGKSTDKKTKLAIKNIAQDCKICAVRSAAPRRFKITIGTADLRFNHEVQVDTMWIMGKPVVHMVDVATHFTAARFIRKQSSAEVWKAIRRMWTLLYCGPPDYLAVDQGSNYISSEFKDAARQDGIKIREAPIETPGSIGIVERYHTPLRRAYLTIRESFDKTTTNDDCLLMATFSVNNVIGPEGLCPMLLVYGALPRPARATPALTQRQRADAIDKAMTEVIKEHAQQKVRFGLKNNGGPRALEQSQELRRLPAGALVWVYRTGSKRWEGPHRFISIEKETAVIQTERARRLFRSTCVKPYIRSRLHEADDDNNPPEALVTTPPAGTNFKDARHTELTGLIENGTFTPIPRQSIPTGTRIFGSRFIDEIKRAGTGMRKKSMLVAQNYQDVGSTRIATKAPTVNRFSQRILLALAPSFDNMQVFTRDITQAYVQSTTYLERPVYISAPKELGLEADMVLQVMKPLYGIPESGLHWYLTYLEHHLVELNMDRVKTDPCVLVRRNGQNLEGMVALQVDDSLAMGTASFMSDEEIASSKFICKPRSLLTNKPLTFNGLTLTRSTNGKIYATQKEKILRLKHPTNQSEFTSNRALAQYIGVCVRPDLCAAIQLLAPGKEPTTPTEMKQLTKTINRLHETSDTGLSFCPLNLDKTKLIIISDAAFGNARGLRSQLGYLILLVDDTGAANIIHYASNRCKRVTRSVLAAEVHGLVLAFDHSFIIQDMIKEILGRTLDVEAYVDSKTLFDVVAKNSNTTEKRLQIDIFALKESYAKGELRKLTWIPGNNNPADALTKPILTATSPLWRLMKDNKLDTEALGWANSVTHKPQSLEC